MHRIIAEADSMNRHYVAFTTDSALLRAAAWYDRHGSNAERVRAHYLLGCAYRDMGEAPQALEQYHTAIELADTTSADCDYLTLSRVYSQMSYLFEEQHLPCNMLEVLHHASDCALKARDTLSAIVFYELRSHAYDILNQSDSVIEIAERAGRMYEEAAKPDYAVRARSVSMGHLLQMGRLEQAGTYLSDYERQEGFFDADGNIVGDHRIYYYVKGLYELNTGRSDSAEYYFRKLLRTAVHANETESAYHGLYALYKHRHQIDSIIKYADLSYFYRDSMFLADNTFRLQRMQSLYDYSNSRRLAAEKTRQVRETQIQLLLAATLVILLAVFIIFIRLRQVRIGRELQQRHERDIKKMQEAQNDLLALSDMRYQDLVREKDKAVRELEQQITQYNELKEQHNPDKVEELLHCSSQYQFFRLISLYPNKYQAEETHWQELQQLFNTVLPRFFGQLNSGEKSLSQQDYRLCMLIRMGFRSKDFFAIMGLQPSTSATIRKRLLMRIFSQDGSAKDFDKMIRDMM